MKVPLPIFLQKHYPDFSIPYHFLYQELQGRIVWQDHNSMYSTCKQSQKPKIELEALLRTKRFQLYVHLVKMVFREMETYKIIDLVYVNWASSFASLVALNVSQTTCEAMLQTRVRFYRSSCFSVPKTIQQLLIKFLKRPLRKFSDTPISNSSASTSGRPFVKIPFYPTRHI